MQLSDLSLRLHALSVLRGVLRLPLVNAYAETLSAFDRSAADFADRYGALCAARFACGDISRSFLNAVHFDVNTLTDTIDAPADALLAAATHDIEVLNGLLALSGSQLCEAAALHFDADALRSLPDFAPSAALPFTTGAELAGYYRGEGYGFFAQSSAFSMQDDGSALPIVHPDTIRLHDLPGYERQKKQVLQNTRAFLDGKDANNILLYGDKGTGKSSTVKAVANEYADRGLKIIQMSPRHITCFPKLFEQTLRSPFRFIVFLDDLTFDREDDNFAALKAFIEGGLAGKPSNLVIYATSNRRHLIKENYSDKEGTRQDMHTSDTVQEKLSLVYRFGVSIYFGAPDKKEFQKIVSVLADRYGVKLSEEELLAEANKWELSHGGLSGRTAQQFIDYLLGKQ